MDCSINGIDECLRNVTLRSKCFEGLEKLPDATPGRQTALEYMDKIKAPFDTYAIYQQLVALLSSAEMIPFILEWAITPLRAGAHKVYVGANLLRFASMDGMQLQVAIHEFLVRLDVHTKVKKQDVYLLVAELVRTGYFSVAVYLRWIIAKGGLSKVGVLDEVGCYFALPGLELTDTAELPMLPLAVGRDSLPVDLSATEEPAQDLTKRTFIRLPGGDICSRPGHGLDS